MLGAQISLRELKRALNNMNKGKSPDCNSIPPEISLNFWNQLGPLLLEMIITAVQYRSEPKGSFGRDANTALIELLFLKRHHPVFSLSPSIFDKQRY